MDKKAGETERIAAEIISGMRAWPQIAQRLRQQAPQRKKARRSPQLQEIQPTPSAPAPPCILSELKPKASAKSAQKPPHQKSSNSSMAPLLEFQYNLRIREVNYGPEVDPALIRKKMPKAVINSHLPPFLLHNGTLRKSRTAA